MICDRRVSGIFFLEETWVAIRCRRGDSDGAPREDSRLVGRGFDAGRDISA